MRRELLALYANGDVTEMAFAAQGVKLVQKLLAVAGGVVSEGLYTHPSLQVEAFGMPVRKETGRVR